MSGFFWLASYPKSGNTWLRLALFCLKNDTPVDFSVRSNFAPVAASRIMFDLALGIESSDLNADEITTMRPRAHEVLCESAGHPLFRKVHDAWSLTPAGEPLFSPELTCGTLYIVRDPRDVAVSFAHHLGVSIDQIIDRMNDPQTMLVSQETQISEQLPQFLGDWSNHVRGWRSAAGARPTLLMRYEDLQADAVKELSKIADYVGIPSTRDSLARAADHTRFDALRAAEDRHGFHEKPSGADRFFRQGRSGAWHDVLTAAQIARIEQAHAPIMRELGYL